MRVKSALTFALSSRSLPALRRHRRMLGPPLTRIPPRNLPGLKLGLLPALDRTVRTHDHANILKACVILFRVAFYGVMMWSLWKLVGIVVVMGVDGHSFGEGFVAGMMSILVLMLAVQKVAPESFLTAEQKAALRERRFW